MTDEQSNAGGWQPLPQGEYDADATAFVKLPEGGVDGLLSDSPLAAPGHGYVPPQITVSPAATAATDPGAMGTWVMPGAAVTGAGQVPQAVQWPDPNAVPEAQHEARHPGVPGAEQPAQDPFAYDPGVTGHWTFTEASDDSAGAVAPHGPTDVTGQWSIPVANGDLPDESGEFTTSALASQWGATAPATLPGGAPAPWATGTGAGQPWEAAPQAQHAETAGQTPAGAGAGFVEPAGAGLAEASEGSPQETEAPAAEATAPDRSLSEEAARESGPSEEAISASGFSEEAVSQAAASKGARSEEAAPTDHAPQDDAPDAPVPAPEAARPEAGQAAPPLHDDRPLASYVLRVNGSDRPVTDAWIGESLLYVLRERLGLAGAKDGCSQGECGACNVQVDGRLVASCLVPAATAAGSEVRTVEGLAADGRPSDVQRALARCGAVQCGFCMPGMAMTVHDLLEGNPAPSDLDARQALCGNLCRCSGYRGVLEAVQEVVAERAASAAATEPAADAAEGAVEEARIPHQAGPGAGGVNPAAYESYEPYDQDGGQA